MAKFDIGIQLFWYRITELTTRFNSTLNNPVYATAFNDSLVFLECARHNKYISDTQLNIHDKSYLCLEHLAILECDKGKGTRIKLIFPPMYHVIVDKLKTRSLQIS